MCSTTAGIFFLIKSFYWEYRDQVCQGANVERSEDNFVEWFSYLYVGLGEGQTQVVRLAWGRQQALLLAKPPSLACFQG